MSLRSVTRRLLPLSSLGAFTAAVLGMGYPSASWAESPLCESFSTNATLEWVTRLSLDGQSVNIAPNTNFYDATNTTLGVATGNETFPIEVDVDTDGPEYAEFVIVWFDLNQDGEIDNVNERIFEQNANVDGNGRTFSGQSITIPDTAFNGTSFGRVIMQYQSNPTLCGSYTYGTTVDFKMTVVEATDNPNAPNPPVNVTASARNASASITITPPAMGNTPDSYTIVAQPGGAEITVTAAEAADAITFPGLTNGVEYTFDVTSHYGYTGPTGQTIPLSSYSATTSNAVTPDGSTPVTPGNLELTDATNSGSTDDNITNVSSATVTGTAEVGSAVEVFVDGTSVGTVAADTLTGDWSFTFADGDLAEGDNDITATAVDAALNASEPSAPLTLTLDGSDPAAPTGVGLSDATNSGSTDDTLTNDTAPTLTGSAEPGSLVEVFVGGTSVGVVTVDGSGTWELALADGDLAEGDNAVTTQATDVAGNVSPVSEATTIALDTATGAPDALALTDATNSGSTDDTLTNVAAAEITGTAEAGAEVEVFVDGSTVGTATADGSGDWSFTFADGDLAQGDNAVTAQATDTADNGSAPSDTLTITLDDQGPAAPGGMALSDATNSGSTDDTTTNVAAAEITGTAEAGAEVEVFVDGTSVGTVTADGSGDWSFTFADGDLAQGDNAITTTSTDPAGTTSVPSPPLTLTLDGSDPAAPTGVGLSDATNSGSTDDTLTNDTAPTLTGSAEPGSQVEVFVGGTSVGVVTVDGSGTWELALADGDLAEGDNAVTTQATDVAGNVSPVSEATTIALDTATGAPDALALTDATNSGSTDDTLTNVAAAEITGTAEAGAEVEVFVDGSTVGTATADGSGDWSFTFADGDLAQGDNAVTAQATDTADNGSAPSDTLTITLDDQGPAAPGGMALSDATNSGSTDDTTTNVAAAEITGTAEAGAEVEVFVDGTSVGTVTADGSGDWSFTFADGDLAQGDNAITTTSTDPAGTTSVPSPPLTLTLDGSDPAAPTGVGLSDATNSGSTDDTLTNDTAPTLTGSAEPGSQVEVFVGGTSVGVVTVDGSGTWELALADGDLVEGDNAVTTQATDVAGNVSPVSEATTIALDTATGAPDALALSDATNSGSTDDTLTNVAAAEITGTAEAGAEVEVFVDGSTVGTATADGNGDWSFTFADGDLAQGDNAVTAQATDTADNGSAPSDTLTITLDDQGPAAPGGMALSDATNSGSTDDTTTNVAAAEITGTAEAGAEVEVFVDGTSVGTVTADGSGDWSFTFADGDLAQGDNAITTTSTDPAGTTSVPSPPLTLTLDGSDPAAPTGVGLSDATNSGSTDDTLTNDTAPTLTGSAEPGSQVEVFVGGTSVGVVTVDGSGTWELALADGDLAEGDNAVTTQATDVAGNVSPVSEATTIVLDTATGAPDALALTDATNSGSTDDTLTNVAAAEITGTAEAGAEVEVFVDGSTVGTATADGSGDWSFTFADGDLAQGDNAVTAQATDSADNGSALSDTLTITLDDQEPESESVVTMTNSSDTGVPGDGITNDGSPQIGGEAEPNATIEVFVNGLKVGNTTAGSDGKWSYNFETWMLSEGPNEITLMATDLAGNNSTPTPPQTLIIDTTLPVASFSLPSEVQNGPFLARLTFNEAVAGMGVEGLGVENGAISNFQQIDELNYTFMVSPTDSGPVTVRVSDGVATDVAGNMNALKTSLSVAADILAPSLTITGPTTTATDTFNVTFTFSEAVTGFAPEDITVTGGSLANLQGDGTTYTAEITPVLGEVVSVAVPAGVAEDIAGNLSLAAETLSVQSGSPALEFEAVRDDVEAIVVRNAVRDLKNKINSSRNFMDQARTRFIQSRSRNDQCFSGTLRPTECPETVGRSFVPFDVDGQLTFAGGILSTQGDFFGQQRKGDAWRVVSGNFNITRDEDGSTSGLISGRLAWEFAYDDQTMLAYFVEGDIALSNINGALSGHSQGYSLSFGAYGVREITENMYVDGYASLGYGITELSISNDTLRLSGGHSGFTFQAGASLTGVYKFDRYEIWPRLSFGYGTSQIGTVNFDAEAYGIVDQVSLEAGDISVLRVSFEPEIRFAIKGNFDDIGSTTFSVTPRLVCQVTNGLSTDSDCSAGLGLDLSTVSDDGLGRFNARLSAERIGGSTQASLVFQFERKF